MLLSLFCLGDGGAWCRCCAPAGLQSGCGCTRPWASCLVRLQLKQSATSTSLQFIPMLMSWDRHSAHWGQVTSSLQPHSLFMCASVLLMGCCWGGWGSFSSAPDSRPPSWIHTFAEIWLISKSYSNWSLSSVKEHRGSRQVWSIWKTPSKNITWINVSKLGVLWFHTKGLNTHVRSLQLWLKQKTCREVTQENWTKLYKQQASRRQLCEGESKRDKLPPQDNNKMKMTRNVKCGVTTLRHPKPRFMLLNSHFISKAAVPHLYWKLLSSCKINGGVGGLKLRVGAQTWVFESVTWRLNLNLNTFE